MKQQEWYELTHVADVRLGNESKPVEPKWNRRTAHQSLSRHLQGAELNKYEGVDSVIRIISDNDREIPN